MEKSNSIKKVCGFYVSSVHLVTMLLPYLSKQIKEQIEVIPFLEISFIYVKILSLTIYFKS